MPENTKKTQLKRLYFEREIKFNEIVSCLRQELYSEPQASPEQVIEEAEELTDNWASAEADGRALELGTELQRLLSEHQHICEQIIKIIDS